MPHESTGIRISLVTSLYRSAPYIEGFHERHLTGLKELGVEYEFIFVDDGSPDNSAAVVRELQQRHLHIKLVSLSRNFGQYAAMFAGLAHAAGDFVYAADCDLEEAPENLPIMYRRLTGAPEADVVYGVFRERQGGLLRLFGGSLFYCMLNCIAETDIPPNQAWQRIMTRRYVQALLSFKEIETLPSGLMALAGFVQIPLEIAKNYKGSTAYTWKKRVRLALNSFTAFSSEPLVLIGLTGLAITAIAFLGVVYVVLQELFAKNYQSGWSSLIVSIWFVGGLLLSSVGIVGLYVARIFNQVKNRPLYIVSTVTESAKQ